jgi:hypothetical protein
VVDTNTVFVYNLDMLKHSMFRNLTLGNSERQHNVK